MAEFSFFDDLVNELSSEERFSLLASIRRSVALSTEPLYLAPEKDGAAEGSEARPDSLSLLYRFFLFLRSLFSGRNREELLKADALRSVSLRIEAVAPGMVDPRRALLLACAADELRKLRDAARYFHDILDRSVDKDKEAFFAFLASIELPQLHERLMTQTNPFTVASFDDEESALRSSLNAAFDDAFAAMDEGGRRAMYQNLRSLLFLKRLSSFLFERLLSSFRAGLSPDGAEAAEFSELRELMLELGDILLSMSQPPSLSLMEALFVFAQSDLVSRPDAAALLGADIGKAEVALGRIRCFNAGFPLGDILKLISGDPAYEPRQLAGGEDWLVLYKNFWRSRIDRQLGDWKIERRARMLAEEISAFAGDPGPSGFDHISRHESEDAPAIQIEAALSFLDAFSRGPMVRDMQKPLKLILVDGEFYRKENRIEFTDAYDSLLRIPEMLSTFDERLGPKGDLGMAWAQVKSEISASSMRQRRLQAIARGAQDDAVRLVKQVASALASMSRLLNGFVKGEAGGHYDSLANLSSFDFKVGKNFPKLLVELKLYCERAFCFLETLSGLDLGALD